MDERNVAPGLLLAMPQLPDPNFQRSVVLMVEHHELGSFGLVVNRPTEMPVEEVLSELEIGWHGDGEAVVWCGGPVEPQRGCVLHPPVPGPDPEQVVHVVPGIVLSTSPEQLRELAQDPPDHLRFLLGYAGWGPGQLEHEMTEGSWVVAPASPELVFETPFERMWQAAIESLGIDPSTLVPASGIH